MRTKLLAIAFLVMIGMENMACKRLNNLPTATDNSYDVENKSFHIIVTGNAVPLNVNITQIRASTPVAPFNTVNIKQYSKINYGFIPQVGDSIKVGITAGGPMSVNMSYTGVPLDNVNVISTATGSKTTYIYVVKD